MSARHHLWIRPGRPIHKLTRGFPPWTKVREPRRHPDSRTAREPDSRPAGQPDIHAVGRPDSQAAGQPGSQAYPGSRAARQAGSQAAHIYEPSMTGLLGPSLGPDDEVSSRTWICMSRAVPHVGVAVSKCQHSGLRSARTESRHILQWHNPSIAMHLSLSLSLYLSLYIYRIYSVYLSPSLYLSTSSLSTSLPLYNSLPI